MPSSKISVSLTLNGKKIKVKALPMARLLDVLREEAACKGVKEGCGEGECGACAVQMNGALVNSCLVPVLQAEGAKIRTVEGLAKGDNLDPVQRAFLECGGAQCGICTPGMLMAVTSLLEENPKATEAEAKAWLAGNLCRCTGYVQILESVKRAQKLRGKA